jgi:hypothetical protein
VKSMSAFHRVVLAGGLVAGLLGPFCQQAEAQGLRDSGHCVLRNVQVNRQLYSGDCQIAQEKTNYGVVMSIKLGEAQAFKFACDKNGRNCMTGPTEVRLQDRGNGSATFRWETFQLDVDASPQAQPQQLRDSGHCVLRNVQANRQLYSGGCQITQDKTDYGVIMSIKLGEAQAFKFACDKNGRNCMTGPTEVRLQDRGNGSATFRWETFQLDVNAK